MQNGCRQRLDFLSFHTRIPRLCTYNFLKERRANFLLQGQLSILTLISVAYVPPQWHVKDPGHFAKSAGGRSQLNTPAPCVCNFQQPCKLVHDYGHRTCAEPAAVLRGTSHFETKQGCRLCTPLRWIFKTRCLKNLQPLVHSCLRLKRGESDRKPRRSRYKNDKSTGVVPRR